MAVIKVDEGVKEVKWNKRIVRRLSKRSMVPPSPAELNIYDPVLSPQSYNNYGNPKPFGVSSDGCSGSDGGASSGSAPTPSA